MCYGAACHMGCMACGMAVIAMVGMAALVCAQHTVVRSITVEKTTNCCLLSETMKLVKCSFLKAVT